jgi:hypothetical protein
LHGPVSSCLFCRDERRKARHVGEVIAGVLGVGVDLDAVLFLDRQAQFQGVYRIQAQAFAEQRLIVADIVDADVFEAQGLDDQRFYVVLKGVGSLIFGELLNEIVVQVIVELARGLGAGPERRRPVGLYRPRREN